MDKHDEANISFSQFCEGAWSSENSTALKLKISASLDIILRRLVTGVKRRGTFVQRHTGGPELKRKLFMNQKRFYEVRAHARKSEVLTCL
jgi:hypothetical protein